MNTITMKLQADHLIEEALREDISSEDVTTNSIFVLASSNSNTRLNTSSPAIIPSCFQIRFTSP